MSDLGLQPPLPARGRPADSAASASPGDGMGGLALTAARMETPSAATDFSLAERLAFERLLGDLSARFADLPADAVIDQLKRALTPVMKFLGFDRCSFAEVSDADGSFHILCSVSRPGIDAMPAGPAPAFSWYFGELRAGRVVVLADLPADLPPAAAVEAAYCKHAGLKSNLAIPLRVGGRVVGAIAFAAFDRTRAWPQDLILRLKLVGEVLAQAVARSRREVALADALEEITRLKERLEVENHCLRQSGRSGCGRLPDSRSPRFNLVLEEIA